MDSLEVIAQTRRLTLHQWGQGPRALEAYFRLYSNPQVMALVGEPLTHRDQARQALIRAGEHQAKYGYAVWAVALRRSGQIIGSSGMLYSREVQLPEAAYHFFPEVWGQGFAREALAAVLKVGFEALGLKEMAAFTMPGHQASEKVLTGNGFLYLGERSLEGVRLREFRLRRGGEKSP